MTLSQTLTKLDVHYSLLLLPKRLKSQLLKEVKKMVYNNGYQWTVDRLKDLKSDLLQILGGNKPTSTWISYKGLLPRNLVWRQVFQLASKSRRDRGIALSILNTYKIFASPSKEKVDKVITNIETSIPLECEAHIQWAKQFYRTLEKPLMSKARYVMAQHLRNIRFSLSAGLNTKKPFVMGGDWFKSMNHTSRVILPTHPISQEYLHPKGSFQFEQYGGELVTLYEGGNKVRVIALPHAELQMFLQPLHKAMNDILQLMPEDCTHDQSKGMRFGQDILKQNRTLHSVDLSAATDRFPLDYQVRCLRSLVTDPGKPTYASIFERCCNLLWKYQDRDIKYRAGQPMGLYGSFAVFAYSHHVLVRSICKHYRIPREPDGTLPYRILGDDIVIGNDQLALVYKSFIQKFGVEISSSKTITSNRIGEFAGFVIDKKGGTKPPKPSITGLKIDNLVNYLRLLKVNPFNKSHRFYEVSDLLLYLPSPIGVGMNPLGLKYLDRLTAYRDSSNDEETKPIKVNRIRTLLFHKLYEKKMFWNPFSREIVDEGVDTSLLYRLAELSDKTEQEISGIPLPIPLTGRAKEDFIQQNVEYSDYKPLLFEGALGINRDVEYVTSRLKSLKKQYPHYPWGHSSWE